MSEINYFLEFPERFCDKQIYGLYDKKNILHSFEYYVRNSFLVCGNHIKKLDQFECPYSGKNKSLRFICSDYNKISQTCNSS